MKKELDFKYPFWQWGGLGFYNCYAAVYMYLQGLNNEAIGCNAKKGNDCNSCSDCSEKIVNLFETIAGQTTVRQSYSGEKTKIQNELEAELGNSSNSSDKLVDFIIGFTGYDYSKVTGEITESVTSSIDIGKPVLAKLKNDNWAGDAAKGYRIITGYDGDVFLGPDYSPAADLLLSPSCDEIKCIYVFGEQTSPKHTFLDLLIFMERVMGSDFSEGIWYDFLHKFDYEGEKLWEVDVAEIKSRFKRFSDVSGWLSCMSHSLQNAFGDRKLLEDLGANIEKIDDLLKVIGHQTHLLHNHGYQANALWDSVNAFQMDDNEKWPWDKNGLITTASLVLNAIIECDMKILIAVKKAIRKLSH